MRQSKGGNSKNVCVQGDGISEKGEASELEGNMHNHV